MNSQPVVRPSRGIDARSLAARPPRSFTITRQPSGAAEGYPDRDASRPRVTLSRLRRGGGDSRGASRGGRGRGVRPKRSGGRGGRREKPKPDPEDEEEAEEEWTEEEIKQMDIAMGGYPTAYEPATDPETLNIAVLTSQRGLVESVRYKMGVATLNPQLAPVVGAEHLLRMGHGGGTFFESTKAKAFMQLYNNQVKQDRAKAKGKEYEPEKLPVLPPQEREILAKAWAAGHYETPKLAQLDDPLGQVQSYTRRNETYLAEDGRKFEETLRSLLPSQYLKGQSGKALPKPL